ncbi:hypothetical protein Back11_42610 [Paenibacillus baekrokdamisoli]|uniref:Copper amine oxidase-like N-terminal domain-containing protein n=1 Tax=Paenibacillus baekrokdamisoli TaxID=1712516 RepID=A0A3G9IWM4_9BACL|nr:stalk domain-containing protein [Paenibacillus baekrokdamisoli]MBB3068037.1 ankyrin repeat protein [Paenibacillus baekrokdamisoli]BBH22916.1 hypothetical protein Back11_42610 [Paenibacillus baekrokdamisoli]
MKYVGQQSRIFCFILALLLFSSPYLAAAAKETAASADSAIQVIANGKPLDLVVKPIILKGNVMLPMKSLFDKIQINASYEKGTILVIRDGIRITASLNQTKVTIGDRVVQLTQPPTAQNGRIYIPVRLVALILNQDVTYDAAKKQVTIGFTQEQTDAFQRNLFEAAMHGDAASAEAMLKKGADPNGMLIKMYGQNTPLDYAVLKSATDVVRVLLKYGARVEHTGQDLGFTTILHQNSELLDMLLTAGLNPNSSGNTGTLLQTASGIIGIGNESGEFTNQLPNVAVVQVLLSHGADPGIDDSLTQAVQAESYPIIQALLQAGADPYKLDSNQSTPYQRSTSRGISKWMKIQDKQPVIPVLHLVDDKGKPLFDGTLALRSNDSTNRTQMFNWSVGTAYLDLPDGSYTLLNVSTYSTTTLMPKGITLVIKDGQVESPELKLPAPNVLGTVSFSSPDFKDNGSLFIYDSTGKYYYGTIQVSNKKFQTYLPAGEYRIVEYNDGTASFEVDSSFTLGENATQLDVSVTVGALKQLNQH